MRVLLLLRDIIKYLLYISEQIRARLLYIKRFRRTSLAINARLDIVPKYFSSTKNFVHDFVLGESSIIEQYVSVNTWHGKVVLGRGCSIGMYSILVGPIEIEDYAVIAQGVYVFGENRKLDDGGVQSAEHVVVKPVKIGRGSWVGSGTRIMPGVSIGEGCVIGAGSVVTQNIPDGVLAAGVPARVIRQLTVLENSSES